VRVFYSLVPRPPRSTPFPYTTLFRSGRGRRRVPAGDTRSARREDRRRESAGLRSRGVRGTRRRHGLRRRRAAVGQKKKVTVMESDRKSTRLNSSHDQISYAVFCLKKK